MHPSSFEYFAPKSMEEAIGLLTKFGEDAKIMAGGQSLIPLLKLRMASFPYVIDISRIEGLDYIEEKGKFLEIGALTTMIEIEDSELIKERYRILREAAVQIADPLVRNRGTIGGNISHGDPSNDMPAVIIALDGKLEITGKQGKKVIDADSFITDYFTTVLQEGEIMSKIMIPVFDGSSGGCYIKQKKNAGDFSVAAIAVHLSIDKEDRVRRAGIGLTSVGPRPLRAEKGERFLEGKRINDSVAREAANIIVSESDPTSDFYGSADYKKKVLNRIAVEAINTSYERAMVR